MGPGEFLNINFFTALFTLFNFIAVFLVLKHFLFKPVMKIIKDRQDEIDHIYADADIAKKSAEEMQAEYQQKLYAATETSERIVKEAVIRGQSKEEEIIRRANAEASPRFQNRLQCLVYRSFQAHRLISGFRRSQSPRQFAPRLPIPRASG